MGLLSRADRIACLLNFLMLLQSGGGVGEKVQRGDEGLLGGGGGVGGEGDRLLQALLQHSNERKQIAVTFSNQGYMNYTYNWLWHAKAVVPPLLPTIDTSPLHFHIQPLLPIASPPLATLRRVLEHLCAPTAAVQILPPHSMHKLLLPIPSAPRI